MTLSEFYEQARLILEKHYENKYEVSVHCMANTNRKKLELSYSCTIWVHDRSKFIESGHARNAVSALKGLEDNIKHFKLSYDQTPGDILV